MQDVPPWPLFYLQDSTQIEKSPDETAVSARCLISQSAAGGWRRPLPLTQHLSPLCTEHLSFLFVLSYYYYQGNFQLSSLTRRQRRRPGSQSGFHTTFLTGGGVGGLGWRGRGDPTSDLVYQLSCFSQSAALQGLFLSRSAPFSFFFFPSTANGFGETPTTEKRRGRPPLGAREDFTCQRAGPESNTMVIHESVHQTSPVISLPSSSWFETSNIH